MKRLYIVVMVIVLFVAPAHAEPKRLVCDLPADASFFAEVPLTDQDVRSETTSVEKRMRPVRPRSFGSVHEPLVCALRNCKD